MARAEAPAWWADVQHLRDVYERTDEARRRADLADVAERSTPLGRQSTAVAERRASDAPEPRPRAEVIERRASDAPEPRPRAEVVERRASDAPEHRRPAEVVERHASEMLERRPAAVAERRLADTGRPAPVARRDPHPRGTAIPARRTIEIRGRTVPAPPVPRVEIDRSRPPRRAVAERVGPHPDRLALWALLMGLLLILVAVGTADASVLAR